MTRAGVPDGARELKLYDSPVVRGSAFIDARELWDVRADVEIGDEKDGIHVPIVPESGQ